MAEIRIPHLQRKPNIAAQFIDTHVEMAEEAVFSPQLNKFVSQQEIDKLNERNSEVWKEAQIERESLLQAITVFQKKYQPQNGVAVDVRTYSWFDMVSEVKKASDEYKTAPSNGSVFKVRKSLRKLSQNCTVFNHWLQLLPTGDYGSCITGSFALILKTAGRMDEVREMIYEAIADIPYHMEHAWRYLETYRGHATTSLIEYSARLYTSILIVLKNIFQYFTENSWKRVGKAIGRGDTYENVIQEGIVKIKKLAREMSEEAAQCSQELVREMRDTLNHVRQGHEDTQKSLRELKFQVNSLSNNATWSAESLVPDRNDILQLLYKMVASNPNFDIRTGTGRTTDIRQTIEYDDNGHLLLEPPVLATDLSRPSSRNSSDLAYSIDEEAQSQAQSIITAPDFRSWLSEASISRVLMIQDQSGDVTEPSSLLSYFCGQFADTLAPTEPAVVLSYICSQHDDANTPRSDASGMMISLLAQLLHQRREKQLEFDLSFLEDKHIKRLANDHLKTICFIFRKLVKQMPKKKMLFVIIDGIPLYETLDKKHETMFAFQALKQLTERRTDVLFKLLLTCPGSSLYIQQYIDPEDVMWVGNDVQDGPGIWDEDSFNADMDVSLRISDSI